LSGRTGNADVDEVTAQGRYREASNRPAADRKTDRS